jgi:hypothetical protein
LALVVSGIGFARLTGRESKSADVPALPATEKSEVAARYYLTLSSDADAITLCGEKVSPQASGEYSGNLTFEKEAPVVTIGVAWKEGSDSHHFAKLVIEAPGEETFTHVFDAPGDIDDFVELPF